MCVSQSIKVKSQNFRAHPLPTAESLMSSSCAICRSAGYFHFASVFTLAVRFNCSPLSWVPLFGILADDPAQPNFIWFCAICEGCANIWFGRGLACNIFLDLQDRQFFTTPPLAPQLGRCHYCGKHTRTWRTAPVREAGAWGPSLVGPLHYACSECCAQFGAGGA